MVVRFELLFTSLSGEQLNQRLPRTQGKRAQHLARTAERSTSSWLRGGARLWARKLGRDKQAASNETLSLSAQAMAGRIPPSVWLGANLVVRCTHRFRLLALAPPPCRVASNLPSKLLNHHPDSPAASSLSLSLLGGSKCPKCLRVVFVRLGAAAWRH